MTNNEKEKKAAGKRAGKGNKSKGGKRAEKRKPTKEKKTANNVSPEKLSLVQRLIAVLKRLPHKFPFWARLKINKDRTVLVIDEAPAKDKRKKKSVAGFVVREATHTANKNHEEIKPNPDKDDPKAMYLKRPEKKPQTLIKSHNKKLEMPEKLKKRYEGNSRKVVDVGTKDDGDGSKKRNKKKS